MAGCFLVGHHQKTPLQGVQPLVHPGAVTDLKSQPGQGVAEAVGMLWLLRQKAEKHGGQWLSARLR